MSFPSAYSGARYQRGRNIVMGFTGWRRPFRDLGQTTKAKGVPTPFHGCQERPSAQGYMGFLRCGWKGSYLALIARSRGKVAPARQRERPGGSFTKTRK